MAKKSDITIDEVLQMINEGIDDEASSYSSDYPQWFMTMDENSLDPDLDGIPANTIDDEDKQKLKEAFGSDGLSKEEQGVLMAIYSESDPKIKPEVLKSLLQSGYLVRDHDGGYSLSKKSTNLFEAAPWEVASSEPSSAVGFRDSVYPKTVDVIQDTSMDTSNSALVTCYRLLVSYPNGKIEIVPETSLPGGVDLEDLVLKVSGNEFFEDYLLPEIQKSFSVVS